MRRIAHPPAAPTDASDAASSVTACATTSSGYPVTTTRRRLLQGAGALLLAPWVQVRAADAPVWQADPFALGVASGDPAPDGFVLWTRLAPEPLEAERGNTGGMHGASVRIAYEIARDPGLHDIVQRGTAMAEAQWAWSVHLEVAGLEPARDYWYRFTSGNATSPVGRARTAPAASARVGRLRLAWVSCANYEHGWYAAYRHLASETPDLVMFLGDYIYEGIDRSGHAVRQHSEGRPAANLIGYRKRHAQYKLDPDLRALHAASTALMGWDDHEVQNNYAGAWSQGFVEPQRFLARRAAAYRAFYEHMPLRARSRPDGPNLVLYRRLRLGDLAEIALVDGRQYRSPPACQSPDTVRQFRLLTDGACPERRDPARSLLGTPQEAWLHAGLAASPTRWNLVAQDVQMAQRKERSSDGATGWGNDNWDGYPAARGRLLEHLRDARVTNPLVLSGDIHSFCAADLKTNFDDPAAPPVATEFTVSSISSTGPARNPGRTWHDDNPHVRFFEGTKRGYATMELDAARATVRYRAVADARDRASGVATVASFTVESGRAGIASQS